MKAHVPRKLDTKMPKATNTLHSDQISSTQAGVAKSVVSRNARAEERGCFRGPEVVRDRRDAARFSNHHFRISSIRGNSRHHGIETIHNISASAWLAHSVFAAKEPNTDPLADFPFGHSAAQGFNAANHFMTWNARQG
jgi:hypothetical protein